MSNILWSTFTDKKEQFNAMFNSATFQEYIDNELSIIGVVVYKDINETGEESTLMACRLESGEYVGTVSQNVVQIINSVRDGEYSAMTKDDPLHVKVIKRRSKNNRDYLSLILV